MYSHEDRVGYFIFTLNIERIVCQHSIKYRSHSIEIRIEIHSLTVITTLSCILSWWSKEHHEDSGRQKHVADSNKQKAKSVSYHLDQRHKQLRYKLNDQEIGKESHPSHYNHNDNIVVQDLFLCRVCYLFFCDGTNDVEADYVEETSHDVYHGPFVYRHF